MVGLGFVNEPHRITCREAVGDRPGDAVHSVGHPSIRARGDRMRAAHILYSRASFYEQKTLDQSRVSVPADSAVQSDIKEQGHANDNIYTGG